jgi:hypothetical protein
MRPRKLANATTLTARVSSPVVMCGGQPFRVVAACRGRRHEYGNEKGRAGKHGLE